MLGNLGFEVPSLLVETVLPVGISFFTFMALSYVIDIYRGDYQPTTLSKFAVFLSFFRTSSPGRSFARRSWCHSSTRRPTHAKWIRQRPSH